MVAQARTAIAARIDARPNPEFVGTAQFVFIVAPLPVSLTAIALTIRECDDNLRHVGGATMQIGTTFAWAIESVSP